MIRGWNGLVRYILGFILILSISTPSLALASGTAPHRNTELNQVVLDSFDAEPDDNGNGVQIAWTTQSEQNTEGFDILRSLTTDVAEATVVSNALITSQGENGGSYEYMDASASVTVRYIYWLRERQNDGNTQFYGPIASLRSRPSAISLAGFKAVLQDDRTAIQVTWQTSAESNTQGFHVLRSITGQREDAVAINTDLIVSQGFQGGSYEYLDSSIILDFTYTYWIEELELDGNTNLYGPIITVSESGAHLAISVEGTANMFYRVHLPLVIMN